MNCFWRAGSAHVLSNVGQYSKTVVALIGAIMVVLSTQFPGVHWTSAVAAILSVVAVHLVPNQPGPPSPSSPAAA